MSLSRFKSTEASAVLLIQYIHGTEWAQYGPGFKGYETNRIYKVNNNNNNLYILRLLRVGRIIIMYQIK